MSGVGFKFEPKLSGCRESGLNLELECRGSGGRDRIEKEKRFRSVKD